MYDQSETIRRRSQLDLIRIAIELNVAAELAAPTVIEFLIHQQALMKQTRPASGRSENRAGLRQGTAGSNDRDIWVAQDVLARAQFDTRNSQAVSLERNRVFFI